MKKPLSTLSLYIGINGTAYEVYVENFKTVTNVYYKKAGTGYIEKVIKLSNKTRNKGLRKIILESMNV